MSKFYYAYDDFIITQEELKRRKIDPAKVDHLVDDCFAAIVSVASDSDEIEYSWERENRIVYLHDDPHNIRQFRKYEIGGVVAYDALFSDKITLKTVPVIDFHSVIKNRCEIGKNVVLRNSSLDADFNDKGHKIKLKDVRCEDSVVNIYFRTENFEPHIDLNVKHVEIDNSFVEIGGQKTNSVKNLAVEDCVEFVTQEVGQNCFALESEVGCEIIGDDTNFQQCIVTVDKIMDGTTVHDFKLLPEHNISRFANTVVDKNTMVYNVVVPSSSDDSPAVLTVLLGSTKNPNRQEMFLSSLKNSGVFIPIKSVEDIDKVDDNFSPIYAMAKHMFENSQSFFKNRL